jgi:phage/plasmid-associated DNA primase
MPAQVLVLAGQVNSGKSVFQKLIVTPLLGGRKTSPYPFLIGRTDFNEDLFRNEHLICDDEQPGKNYETRTQFAAGLKKFVASDSHWCHGKGKKALTLPPFWRITVSVNDTPDCLQSIPVNDETMKDKMIVLRT